MIVEVADHPFILLGELEISLPEAFAVLTLKSALTQTFLGLGMGLLSPAWFRILWMVVWLAMLYLL
jgi:hypothetical protein